MSGPSRAQERNQRGNSYLKPRRENIPLILQRVHDWLELAMGDQKLQHEGNFILEKTLPSLDIYITKHFV